MTESRELTERITALAHRLKGGEFADQLFVESFVTASEIEDAKDTFFPEFFDDFHTETSGILAKVQVTVGQLVEDQMAAEPKGVSRDQLAEAFRYCHMLKGSAATMGFNKLSYLAHGLERMFETLKDSDDDPMVLEPELVATMKEACELLQETLAGMTPQA